MKGNDMRLHEVLLCENDSIEDEYTIGIHGSLPGKQPSEIIFDLEFPNMRTAFRFIERFGNDYIVRYDLVPKEIHSAHDHIVFTITFILPS